ncbi:MAG: bifunctional homocysteine S-methyltransferase/methylenetetrahydrofolate reductase [Clostridiales bacterium]|jgi:methionine synthase I (cobalamin-dependent)/5,10-methylenetetrahydrofolate reductase|nr:bifunctional homocysteine S-methyltransferase/methylenetetrahydrofolate reductase [Clostridiales bacterium]
MSADTFLFDGAFGTYYTQLTNKFEPCELANLDDRQTVFNIHKSYIDAGVDAIKTNTFGANSGLRLDFETVEQIIKEGYNIALDAAKGVNAQVFADIGPIPHKDKDQDLTQEYIKIADVFLGLGAQKFLFETMPEYNVLKPVFKHIKKKNPNSYIIASFASSLDGYTKSGLYYKQLLDKAQKDANVDAIGLNCLCGPAHIIQLVEDYQSKIVKPMSVMPNSGYPETIGNRLVYIDNADYFAKKLLKLRKIGITILGGCCGTTPLHIQKSRLLLNDFKGGKSLKNNSYAPKEEQKPVFKNIFYEKLENNLFPVAVELKAPIDTRIDYLINGAKNLLSAGADLITIADSPLSRTRADSFIVSAKIKREVNIDVLPHLTCRDKNIISIKATLLGLNIEGVQNVFVVTGDPIVATDRSSIKGVFDFNSIGLIKYIQSLNQNVFLNSPFLIGAALNTNAVNFNYELKRAQQKIEAGAKFFLTQPIFGQEGIDRIKKAKDFLNTYILAGIIPPYSYKNAVFLNNEVSGISIPQDLILAMKKAQNQWEVSFEYAIDIINKLKPVCDGLYIINQSKKTDLVARIVAAAKSL